MNASLYTYEIRCIRAHSLHKVGDVKNSVQSYNSEEKARAEGEKFGRRGSWEYTGKVRKV